MDKNDILAALANSATRDLLRYILEMAGSDSSSFDADALRMAYKTGRKDLAQFITNMIKDADHEMYLKFVREGLQNVN